MWSIPEWFKTAVRLYPHAVEFEIKDDDSVLNAHAWCAARLGPPARMKDLEDYPHVCSGLWIPFGTKVVPQVWFQDEKDASLFKVFFG